MHQIADWLKKLGMSEYAQRFAEERIEIDVLPELTDQDLERLSIPLGHRRRMLRAIRELAGSPPAPSQTVAATEPTRQDDAERRQLTVMFCDLVGSTVDQARPRGHAPCDRGLSQVRRGDGRPVRRLPCQIHGRWGAGVFRLSASARGRWRPS